MRVLLVSPYDFSTPGGVTQHVGELASDLNRRDHEVSILAPCARPGLESLPSNLIPIGSVTTVPTNGSLARISLSVAMAGRVRDALATLKPDIVHVHEPFMPLLPYVILRESRAANVATFHAYSGNELGYRHGRGILNRFVQRLDGQIAVSDSARSFVARHFDLNLTVIPNGVRFGRFATARGFEHLNDGLINILFVGRLDERKGFDYLLRAFAQIRRRVTSIRLLVVGPYDDRQRERYITMARRREVPNVLFCGLASTDDLPRFYASSHIVCAPSLGGESFGMVLLEAMAAGRPIVASRITGYRDLVDDGVEGILTPPADCNSLCRALAFLLENAAVRAELGAQGQVKAARYDWPLIGDEIIAYYEAVLARRTRAIVDPDRRNQSSDHASNPDALGGRRF